VVFEVKKRKTPMRCDEVQEHIIEFVYDEGGAPPANLEAWEHLSTCSACRGELEELRQVRKYLQLWKNEPPLRSMAAGHEAPRRRRFVWRYARYAAVAAMAVLCLLALANAKITWNRNGFSFSTRLFKGQDAERDYYTKTELRQLMKQALDDSEFRTNEANYLMMQKVLDMVERDRWMDLRLVRGPASRDHNK
jgi:predicted anti-sigma-YlaC factor YlaD